MAYRPREYVPGVYEPNDDNVARLMLAQSQNAADRVQRNSAVNALMWRGIGESAEGMLSGLAKYKREAPLRAEEERKRREADKLRGLQRMAGEGKMDQGKYGELLQQEGFMDLGQEVLDKDMARKATKSRLDAEESDRQQKEMSEVYRALRDAADDPNPQVAYAAMKPGLIERLGPERYKKLNLPDQYDEAVVRGITNSIGTHQDRTQRNNEARSSIELAQAKRGNETAWTQALGNFTSLKLPGANDVASWEAVFADAEEQLKDSGLDPAAQKRVLASLPHSRTFSPDALETAKRLDPKRDKTTNILELKLDGWKRTHGNKPPQTAAEWAEFDAMATPAKVYDPMDLARTRSGIIENYTKSMQWISQNLEGTERARAEAQAGQERDSTLSLLTRGGRPGAGGADGKTEGVWIETTTGPVWFANQRAADDAIAIAAAKKAGGMGGPDANADDSLEGGAKAPPGPGMLRGTLDYVRRGLSHRHPPVGTVAPPAAAVPAPPAAAPSRHGQAIPSSELTPFRSSPAAGAPPPPIGPPPPGMPAPFTTGRLSDLTGSLVVPPAVAPGTAPAPAPRRGGSGGASWGETPPAAAPPAAAPAPPAAPATPLVTPPKPNAVGGLTEEQIVTQADVKIAADAPIEQRFEALQLLMKMAGYDVRPISLKRSAEEQADLHAAGRTPRSGKPGDESQHQLGTAGDFVFFKDGKRVPSDDMPWELFGLAAQRAGLEWGGNYNDRNHVELPPKPAPKSR